MSLSRLLAAAQPTAVAIVALADMTLATVAPLAAQLIRRGNLYQFNEYVLYWAVAVISSVLCIVIYRTADGIWRYFTWRDLGPLALAALTAVGTASLITFSFDRMGAVARAEPLIHAAILFVGLALIRTVARQVERARAPRPARAPPEDIEVRHAVVIGTTPLADVYLRMVEEAGSLARTPVYVAALLSEGERQVGRFLRGHEVIGAAADLEHILTKLAVHGVNPHLVVIATAEAGLPEPAAATLARLEREGVTVVRLEALMGEALQATALIAPAGEPPGQDRQIPATEPAPPPELGTWRGKRPCDAIAAVVLFAAILPVWAVLCLLVLIDLGRPVIFWQVRPGFRGMKTRFYKFRTMRYVYRDGVIAPDSDRISAIGRLIRRYRLDELPQLLNVLRGQMSFIGPRPLLVRDLHEDVGERIHMRPGITGWAQVNGGTLLTPQQKILLDLWYARHASFGLDMLILWRTLLTVLRGDRINAAALEAAAQFHDQQMQGRLCESAPARVGLRAEEHPELVDTAP